MHYPTRSESDPAAPPADRLQPPPQSERHEEGSGRPHREARADSSYASGSRSPNVSRDYGGEPASDASWLVLLLHASTPFV
jgi:hypothetical protein